MCVCVCVCVHVDVLMVENLFFFTRGFVDDFWFGNSLQSNNNAIHAEFSSRDPHGSKSGARCNFVGKDRLDALWKMKR